jgi:hypothetical protein
MSLGNSLSPDAMPTLKAFSIKEKYPSIGALLIGKGVEFLTVFS